MNELIGQLAFVSIFHIIGGIAIGSTVRNLRKGLGGRGIFFLIWGAGFGCMPLVVGAGMFAQAHAIYLFAVEVLVLVGAIGVTAFFPDWMLETFKSAEVMNIWMGGLFFFVGVGAGAAMLKTEPLFALLFGGAFAGAGALVFYRGLRALL
jgi:hypothetical protein